MRLLDQKGDAVTGAPAPSDSPDVANDRVHAIVCAACGATIANERDRIEVFGAHEHDRMNPGGYLFRIACFCEAEGALAVGPPSDEFPWFPKHTWRIVVCRACGVHLGWLFVDRATTFFGLIVEKLREAKD